MNRPEPVASGPPTAAQGRARLVANLPRAAIAALPVALLAVSATLAASPDDNVEWQGLSHVGWMDRRPLCPVGGESFEVRFQAYRFDITSARVQVDDGAVSWIPAAFSEDRGPYAIWSATIPSTGASTLSYFLEITDGTDTDYYSVSGPSDLAPVDGGFALDFPTLSHAPIGATPSTSGTVFKVWAPSRTNAHVRGEFNSWGLTSPMLKVGEHFVTLVAGTVDRQQYKYFFNNSVWNSDARARSLNPSNNLNSHLEDPFRFAWTTSDFPTPPLEEMVIYQLHVGTFAGRNDPAGGAPFPSRYVDVAQRVAHLEELGVNAVLLNPITEFAGDISAGYNPISQWAPEWKYGTPDDFKTLVDAFHERGIAVLIDVVWNHFSSSDNFLWFYDGTQIYFDSPTVETPWGSQADFDEPNVADYFADSALMWLEEYRVDGFRMDATDYMNVGSHSASGWALMQRLNDEVDNRFVDRVTIAEQLPDDSAVTRPTSLGGAGFDSQYHDRFVDDLRQEIFDSAFGSPEMWRIRDIVNGSGSFMTGSQVLNYLELHDEAWPTSGGQRIVKSIDPVFPHDDAFARGRVKLAQGLVMFAPGVPAILQGTEWLEDTDWGTDVGNRIDWSHKTAYADIFAYFQAAIALRTGTPAFFANSPHFVSHLNDGNDLIGFSRHDGQGNRYYVLANFSDNDFFDYRVGVPEAGTWNEVLNSQHLFFGGTGLGNPAPVETDPVPRDSHSQSLSLTVPRLALLVFSNGSPVVDAPDAAGSGGAFALSFANPFRPDADASIAFSVPEASPVRLDVFDGAGRRVATLADGERAAGEHRIRWDGRTRSGEKAGSGVYFVRLRVAGGEESRKLILVR